MLPSIMLSDLSIRHLAFRILCSPAVSGKRQVPPGDNVEHVSYMLMQAMKCLRSVVLLWKLDTRLVLQQFLLKGSLGKSQTSGLFYLRTLKDKENTLVYSSVQ